MPVLYQRIIPCRRFAAQPAVHSSGILTVSVLMQWRKKQRHQAVSESKFRMELIEPRVLLSADILLAPMIATQEESEPASITLVQDSKYEIQFETTPDSSDDSN